MVDRADRTLTSATEGREVLISAVVLAAGRSTRMGGQKLVCPFRGRPLVLWAVEAALGSKATETIVVTGHEAGQIADVVRGLPVRLVHNPDYSGGMSTSLKAGALAATGGYQALAFILGDQPFVTSSLLDRLIDLFIECGKIVVRPLVEGRPGHPVVVGATLIPDLLLQQGDVGGREVLGQRPGDTCYLPVGDPRVNLDIDTITDLERADAGS